MFCGGPGGVTAARWIRIGHGSRVVRSSVTDELDYSPANAGSGLEAGEEDEENAREDQDVK